MHLLRPEQRRLRNGARRQRKVSAHELGVCAEIAAADYLFAHGFTLLHRNLRAGPLEVDIVARRGPLLVAVEVRARAQNALVGPFASVTQSKRNRVLRAVARWWQTTGSQDASLERVRIDAAAVTFRGGKTFVEYAPGVV